MPIKQSDTAESDPIDAAGLQLDLHIEGLLRQATDLIGTITREQEDTLASATASTLRQHTRVLQHTIEWLSSRIPPLNRRVQEIRSLLSPIQCLPPELLSRIFLLAVPDVWYRAPSGGMTLPFASVCSRWRAVALSMPQLWNSIIISPQQIWDESRHTTIRSRQSSGILMSTVNAYVARSAGAPLKVTYATHAPNTYRLHKCRVIDDLPPQIIWMRLLEESTRWTSLDLSCPMNRFRINPGRPKASFPRLQSLRFSAVEDSVHGHDLISFFSDAPLRRLDMRGKILSPYARARWPSTWQLSHLHLVDIPTDCVIGALTAFAPHLEDVKVRHRGISNIAGVPSPFATLPKLHTLNISGAATPAVRVRAPALTRLVLSDGKWIPPEPEDDLDHLAAFLALDSHSSLTHLKLDNITGSSDRLLSLLPALPTLTCLWISNRSKCSHREPQPDLVTPLLVKRLTRVRGSPASLALLPRLKALALFAEGRCSPEIDEPALDMLRSRMEIMEYEGLDLQPLLALRSDISNVRLCRASCEDEYE